MLSVESGSGKNGRSRWKPSFIPVDSTCAPTNASATKTASVRSPRRQRIPTASSVTASRVGKLPIHVITRKTSVTGLGRVAVQPVGQPLVVARVALEQLLGDRAERPQARRQDQQRAEQRQAERAEPSGQARFAKA